MSNIFTLFVFVNLPHSRHQLGQDTENPFLHLNFLRKKSTYYLNFSHSSKSVTIQLSQLHHGLQVKCASTKLVISTICLLYTNLTHQFSLRSTAKLGFYPSRQ